MDTRTSNTIFKEKNYKEYGLYNTNFKIVADYELLAACSFGTIVLSMFGVLVGIIGN